MDSFTSYLTYEEYQELGGTLSYDAFNKLERKAQRWLDYFTFNRIKQLQKLQQIPREVKEVLVEYVNYLDTVANQREKGDLVTQYSNGVEQLTYKIVTEDELRSELNQIALQWLPDYLTYRGVNFDVSKYIQSNNNNPQ